MDRHTFLDALAWLRRVHEDEFQWPLAKPPTRDGVRQYLPPVDQMSDVSCSGCFHRGSRICYFRTTHEEEDQTLLRVEIVSVERRDQPTALLVRFDQDRVFEVALSAIQSVVLPAEVRAEATSKLPPFGGLDFGSVGLRLWLEPHDLPPNDAWRALNKALRRIDMMRSDQLLRGKMKLRKPTIAPDVFRHNRWAKATCDERARGLSVSEMLVRGSDVLASEEDHRKLKTVVQSALDQKRLRQSEAAISHSRDHERSFVEGVSEEYIDAAQRDPESEGSDMLSASGSFHVVSALTTAFGEKHTGLHRLLRTSIHSNCTIHEGCSTLSHQQDGECVTRKWRKWDDFLQLASSAARSTNKRQRTSNSSTVVGPEDSIMEAGKVFALAMLDPDQVETLHSTHTATSTELNELENIVFTALFPLASIESSSAPPRTPVLPRRRSPPRTATPPNPVDHQSDAPSAEHAWNLLLESRRALVRHELTALCLPRRAHEILKMATKPTTS